MPLIGMEMNYSSSLLLNCDQTPKTIHEIKPYYRSERACHGNYMFQNLVHSNDQLYITVVLLTSNAVSIFFLS